MQPKGKARVERSAGGAVLVLREGQPHLAMIATREKTRWGLPKGAANRGESAEDAAVREVFEETGLVAEIVGPLETIEYFFRAGGDLIHKYVQFFLMAYREGELRPQLSEVDDAEWVPLREAVVRSSFPSEKKMLEDLLMKWDGMDEEGRGRYAV